MGKTAVIFTWDYTTHMSRGHIQACLLSGHLICALAFVCYRVLHYPWTWQWAFSPWSPAEDLPVQECGEAGVHPSIWAKQGPCLLGEDQKQVRNTQGHITLCLRTELLSSAVVADASVLHRLHKGRTESFGNERRWYLSKVTKYVYFVFFYIQSFDELHRQTWCLMWKCSVHFCPSPVSDVFHQLAKAEHILCVLDPYSVFLGFEQVTYDDEGTYIERDFWKKEVSSFRVAVTRESHTGYQEL